MNPESHIPKPFLKLFPEKFNAIQLKTLPAIWDSDQSLIIAAPTGSGKTTIALMALLKGLLIPAKVLYLAPLRALNKEKFDEFKSLEEFKWSVKLILGGDDLPNLQNIDLLISTPEKILSILNTTTIVSLNFRVVVIDEIHSLGSERRGIYLEYLLNLLHHLPLSIRIIGLSATIPNADLIAEWLDAQCLMFSDEYRSSPLKLKIIEPSDNIKSMLVAHASKSWQISKRFLPEQSLVFTTSRASAMLYGYLFCKWFEKYDINGSNAINKTELQFTNPKLRSYSKFGVGVYHAGLYDSDRNLILQAFAQGDLSILIATSSLAWGINLPAKAVIIGEIEFSDPINGPEMIESSDLHQMLGRAGRVQYHHGSPGYGYIIAPKEQHEKLTLLIDNKLPIQSQILNFLPEILLLYLYHKEKSSNFELEQWFQSLFLCFKQSISIVNDIIESMYKGINRLRFNRFIQLNASTEYVITMIGKLVVQYFVSIDTAAKLLAIRPELTVRNIIPCLTEFQNIPIRTSEKKFLRSIGATPETYQMTKLVYVIETLDKGQDLSPELAVDGSLIYEVYIRLLAFYKKVLAL